MGISSSHTICKPLIFVWIVLMGSACTKKGTQNPPAPAVDTEALVKACHYIQGGGASATGGSLGTVYAVTTLEDEFDRQTGTPIRGSLRYAINQTGARIIIFKVAGTIHLTEPLVITNSNITILGQSAPGDGICLADYPLVISRANNVVIRFIRCRLGQVGMIQKGDDYDALSVNDGKRIVIDHCSCSWSIDECVSCYGNEDFTLQYCFITESLRNAGHAKGAHGYGGIWGGKNASFHHNLLAHHDSRNPRFDHDYVNTQCAGPIDFVNNVVYNWGSNSAYGGEGSTNGAGGRQINFVNNYFKPGPATKSGVKTRLLNPTTKCGNCTSKLEGSVEPGKFFLAGNHMDGSAEVTNDNWQGVQPDEANKLDQCKASTRWTDGLTTLSNELSAEAAYETILSKAGCSYQRDAVDERIITEVRNNTGKIIDTPYDVGGWPELKTAERPQDTDGDGIPDEWETKYGLSPDKPSDANTATLVEGMSNLEVYLCYLVRDLYD